MGATNENLCCAECGQEGGVSLKTCTSCKHVKYCNANCQRNHWPKHKKPCKRRAAELRDEVLFKDPPPICFLPMPIHLLSCISLPPATISSVPIYDFMKANETLDGMGSEYNYSCCGKTICLGCKYSIIKCPHCNSDRDSKTFEEGVEEIFKRVEANDPRAMWMLASYYSD